MSDAVRDVDRVIEPLVEKFLDASVEGHCDFCREEVPEDERFCGALCEMRYEQIEDARGALAMRGFA